MNTYKPLRLTTIDKEDNQISLVIREYSLYNINVSEMMLSGKYKSVAIDEIPAHRLYTYNGFYCEYVDDMFVAHDLRANEGMLFSSKDKDQLYLMIENCLHDLALEEEKERVRKAIQLERSKSRS
jgi:hypothetical protein